MRLRVEILCVQPIRTLGLTSDSKTPKKFGLLFCFLAICFVQILRSGIGDPDSNQSANQQADPSAVGAPDPTAVPDPSQSSVTPTATSAAQTSQADPSAVFSSTSSGIFTIDTDSIFGLPAQPALPQQPVSNPSLSNENALASLASPATPTSEALSLGAAAAGTGALGSEAALGAAAGSTQGSSAMEALAAIPQPEPAFNGEYVPYAPSVLQTSLTSAKPVDPTKANSNWTMVYSKTDPTTSVETNYNFLVSTSGTILDMTVTTPGSVGAQASSQQGAQPNTLGLALGLGGAALAAVGTAGEELVRRNLNRTSSEPSFSSLDDATPTTTYSSTSRRIPARAVSYLSPETSSNEPTNEEGELGSTRRGSFSSVDSDDETKPAPPIKKTSSKYRRR